MLVLHIVAEIVVFFSAICIIYYFFQITQAQGDKHRNYVYCLSAVIVLLLAAPAANLARQKNISPTDQVSNQVRKIQKKHQSQRESQQKKPSQQSSTSTTNK
ncbi:hypothetical protein [Levilactobacillus sp. N40-8-2]|uniref:hypothetical protein n=1 Tax=Levilactobacillus muriae TaxID=3238987 RepID=UPI0038B32C54